MNTIGTQTHNNHSLYEGFCISYPTKERTLYHLKYRRLDGSQFKRGNYCLSPNSQVLICASETILGMTQSLQLNVDMINDLSQRGTKWVQAHLLSRKYHKAPGIQVGGTPIGVVAIRITDIVQCPIVHHMQYHNEQQYQIQVYTNPQVFWKDEITNQWKQNSIPSDTITTNLESWWNIEQERISYNDSK